MRAATWTPPQRAAETPPSAGETLLDWKNRPSPEALGWSVEDAVILGGVAVMVAPTESFKSWVSMYLIHSWLTGEDWMGRKVRPVERVWCVSNEKSEQAVRKRFLHVFDGLADDLLARLEMRHNEGVVYGSDRMQDLEREVQEGPQTSAVVLDTHSSLFPSGFSEGVSAGGSMVLDVFRDLRLKTETNVLLVGHVPYADAGRLRGWSGIEAAVDDRIILRRPLIDKNDVTLFTRPKDGIPGKSYHRVDAESLKMLPAGGTATGVSVTVQAIVEAVTDTRVEEERAATVADITAAQALSGVSEKTIRNKVTEAKEAGLIVEWERVTSQVSNRSVQTYVTLEYVAEQRGSDAS